MGNSGSIKPGERRNPNGRPKKGTALTDLLRTYLDKKAPGDLVTRKQMLAEELYRRAAGGWVDDPANPGRREYVPGSPDLLKYLWDRVDGKPVQSLEHSGKDGEPIDIGIIRRVIVKPGDDAGS